MTNEELKAAIKYVNDFATDVDDEGLDRDGNARHFFNVVKASSELLQLKEGTHPDMVIVKMAELDLRYEQGRRDELNKLALAAAQKGNAK